MDWITNLVDPRRRISNWLLLHHPRIWRLRPLEGLAVSTAIWVVGLGAALALRRALTDDPANRNDVSDGLSVIFASGSFVAWMWWAFQRIWYPCNALPWRQRLRGLLWIDLGFWLAFLLPMPSLKPLVMGESVSPADVAIASAVLVGGWVLLKGSAVALVAVGAWLSRKDPERLFRWFRWDVLLGPALRRAGRAYETDLASRRPLLWHLRLHRLVGILPVLVALQLLVATIGLGNGAVALASAAVISLFFLLTRVLAATYGPMPQAFAPDLRWVFLHALATSALVIPGLLLAHSLGLFKPFALLDGRDVALLLWSATWIFVLAQYFLGLTAETFVGCATAAVAFGLATALPSEAVQAVMSVLWAGCSLYLMMPRFHSRQLRREAVMALLVMSAAAGVFIALAALPDVHPEPAWQLVLFDAAVLLVARLGPLEVLQRRRVVPAPT